ncbi:2Fe-2S iron-sulfur cluster-binding protein [Granulibacter bethesdensis]|uniref:Ring hydroxylating dioxygenase oxidoreductase subunit n=1 Tax=Granulibacter bethesdensis (strain ATCC BAA-1260 / CGDNIH1) TaxID=391165 RepID=Q0BW29_GRABC|nr:2Fe-2S iron-sulfur cluster-binding protein [Granulibacter bethesdensis]ABI60973.1 Ring hydroxylating dioxygenase oxidoreductase subunit [Granulibacter bethesdensis CGDNIH1]APH50740.1 Ring hydroxylating dioxygenase oxidoreductase subunit [Granulibacter bethesdensis]APH58358.1 Ring hydroxylating dioxygenase oxidoreductase subunit [Granulibacter bethesdensis]APH63435.1 Ring hydroxylating dioxygenase oxidoreductase subunit [Granulibacter bethesdensis]
MNAFSPLSALPAQWNADADDVLICRAVRQETHDVRTFFFSPANPCLFRHLPGQFVTLDLEIGGQKINRCYTISSAPTRPDLLSITVKRVPNGPVSNWLHDTLKPGMRIRAVGPMGDFTNVHHPAPKYLFLSGGSGITPLMAMARTQYDLAAEADTVFVHAARSPADIIFRDELSLMARTRHGFSVAFLCETDSAGEIWNGYRGRLNTALLTRIAPDFMEREVFVCGPAPFMAAAKTILAEAGFDMRRHHEESFDFGILAQEEPEAAAEAEAVAASGGFSITFSKSDRQIDCDPDTTVLQAGRRAGLKLPASCSKGVCGTCKSKLVSGRVEMKHNGGIRQKEVDQGMFLPCCSRPLTDLVVER